MYAHSQEMPHLAVDTLTFDSEFMAIARGVVGTRGESKGLLRASKPQVTRTRIPDSTSPYGDRVEVDPLQGKTSYVWRMVAFYVSPKSRHHCMPCTAEFDLPTAVGPETRALTAELQPLIDAIVDLVPTADRHGVRRWGQVFGVVGTAEYTPEGAVVYR